MSCLQLSYSERGGPIPIFSISGCSVIPIIPTISAYTRWNCLATVCNYRCQQIEINSYPDSPLFISTGFLPPGQFDAAELIRYMITKPHRRQPDQTHLNILQMSGDVTSEPRPCYKVSLSSMYFATSQVGELATSATKCYGWVYAKCSGILNAAQYRRKGDWTCDACLAPQSQQSPPPTRSPAPPTKQISDDSTFNVLQLNANGIGNKLT